MHAIPTYSTRLLLVLSIGLLLVSCNSEPIIAEWHDPATDINGKPDLSELKGLRIKNVNARFVIANDDEQLILAIQTSDEALQRQIEVGGVTLWLTNPQNKRETIGVRYPALPNLNFLIRNLRLDIEKEARDRMLRERGVTVELLAKKGESRMLNPAEANAAGVIAETTSEANTVAHLITLQFDSLAPWMQAGNDITLSLYIPKSEGPRRMRPDGDDFEGRPPMSGDMGGMGRPGGGMGRRGEGMPSRIIGGKEIRIQQTVVLATAK